MCSILITSGLDQKEHVRLAGLMEHRGLEESYQVFDLGGHEVNITHRRLPMQNGSTPQPTLYEDNLGSSIYFVGELYEDYSGDELAALVEHIEKNQYCDWEGTLMILSEQEGELLVNTDPLRKRPLFHWAGKDGKLILTNEFKLFFLIKPIPEINEQFLAKVMRNGYSTDNDTSLEGVNILKPGLSHFNFKNFTFQHPFHFDVSKPQKRDPMNIPHQLEDAIERRIAKKFLQQDYAIYLSGGVDSMLLAKTIVEVLIRTGDTRWCDRKIPAIIIEDYLTPEEKNNIYSLQDDICPFEFHWIKSDKMEVTPYDVMAWTGSPVDLGSVKPQILLAIAAREISRKTNRNIHAVLTGDGADELFGGYRRTKDYDSQHYDIYSELIHYHNIRLDQIPFKNTIEIRTPFQCLPMLELALSLPYRERIDKPVIRKMAGIETAKSPLKVFKKNKLEERRDLVEEFRRYHGNIKN